MSTKLRSQVLEFHEEFGVPSPTKPEVPALERVHLRLRLISEEFLELFDACGARQSLIDEIDQLLKAAIESCNDRDSVSIVGFADACADLDYVVEGSRIEFGIDGEPVADEVHRSNRTKFGAPVNEFGKIQKGSNYSKPDIARVLRKQGWLDES